MRVFFERDIPMIAEVENGFRISLVHYDYGLLFDRELEFVDQVMKALQYKVTGHMRYAPDNSARDPSTRIY